MSLLCLGLPLLGFIIARPIYSISLQFISTICVVVLAHEVILNGSSISIELFDGQFGWFSTIGFKVSFGFYFDGLTIAMLFIVNVVALCVLVYSLDYMSSDPHLTRFFSYLSLFIFAMTLLLTADNFVVLFLGWEFVGIASYLLINFWFTRENANSAALKAFLLNRVGDWALALGLLLILSLIYDFIFTAIFSLASYMSVDLLLFISLFLICGASAKSALVLLGLHTWLPMAMEGLRQAYKMGINGRNYSSNSNNGVEIQLTNFEKEAILGLILGDGYLSIQRTINSNCRLEFTFQHLWFCEWLIKGVLAQVVTNNCKPTPYPKSKPTQYWFGTRMLPYFTRLRSEFYVDNIKIIPLSLDGTKFTAVSLAYLIMSDGYFHKSSANNGNVVICTECFSLVEVNHLIAILRQMGLVCHTTRRYNYTTGKPVLAGYRINFSSRGTNLRHLQQTVLPFMHPDLTYKLGLP